MWRTDTQAPVVIKKLIDKEDIRRSPLRKVVIIGDGGLGKSTLGNKLLECDKCIFLESDETEDCTIDIAGGERYNRFVIIDTPGYRFDESKWWDNMLDIGSVHGVIMMIECPCRVSGLSHWKSLYQYFSSRGIPFKIYVAGDNIERMKSFGFKEVQSRDILSKDHTEIQLLVQWLDELPIERKYDIRNPLSSIEKAKSLKNEPEEDIINLLMSKLATLNESSKRKYDSKIRTCKDSVERIKKALFDEIKFDKLADEIAFRDPTDNGLKENAPNANWHYIAWAPGFGSGYLYRWREAALKLRDRAVELDKKAEVISKLVNELIHTLSE